MIDPEFICIYHNCIPYKISTEAWLATREINVRTYQLILDLDFVIEIEFELPDHKFWENLNIIAVNTIIENGMYHGIRCKTRTLPK